MGVEVALALGLTGLAASATAAVVNAGIAFGLSYAASRLTGKRQTGGSQGISVSLALSADQPRTVILGEAATFGSLHYWHLTGANNSKLCMVIALADHECEALSGVIVNGVKRTMTGEYVDDFSNKLKIRFYNGAPGQVADADVIAESNGKWTAAHKGAGICYAVVWATYGPHVFPGGIPKIQFVVKGAKLTDPRTGAVGYSDNWGVCVYNVLRGIKQNGLPLAGLNASAASITAADAVAACNVSDELVALAAGGTERRYRVGAVLYSTMSAREQLETVLAAGGDVIESAGLFRILPDVAQAPVVTLTDDDIIAAEPFQWNARRPRSNLINTIEATWLSPKANYAPTSLPARSSSADRAADGGIRLTKTLDLSACPSETQAQRVMEIVRRMARKQGAASATFRASRIVIEPGDWVAFTSARYGWTNRTFAVTAVAGSPGLTSTLTLAEVDGTIDDWDTGLEIANTAGDLPAATLPESSISGLALTSVTIAGDAGAQRSGLHLTWSPIDDATVDRVQIEYRVQGDTVALTRTALEPSSGQSTWIDGVQGGLVYEARARMETTPVRATQWTAWVAATAQTAPVVIDAAITATPAPGSVTGTMLDAQSVLDLILSTNVAEINGSLAGRVADLDTLTGTVAGQGTRLTTAEGTIAGYGAKWSVQYSVDGYVMGAISLNGQGNQASFGVLAANFFVAQPNVAGGAPKQVFTVGNNTAGAASIILNGNVYAPGSIHASALVADSITTLYVTDPNNLFYYDFVNGKQGSTDGKFLIDAKNKRISISV